MTEPTVVFDASALLALLNDEPGADVAEGLAAGAAISSVNRCETFGRLRRAGVLGEALRQVMLETGIPVLPFEREDSERASDLAPSPQARGLSLAGRACLAAAERLGVPVVTADRAWKDLDLGIEVVCIR